LPTSSDAEIYSIVTRCTRRYKSAGGFTSGKAGQHLLMCQ
jgi:hypothetical protein